MEERTRRWKRLKSFRENEEGHKDTKEAFYEEEPGEPNEDVIIRDNFQNGETLTFVWNRGKSNANIKDSGQGKEGFSFYLARYVYRDPYRCKNIVRVSNPGGLSVVGKPFAEDKPMVVIQEKREKDKEGNLRIRIFSAYYANSEIALKYFNTFYETTHRNKGVEKHLCESDGDDTRVREIVFKFREDLKKTRTRNLRERLDILRENFNICKTSIQVGTEVSFTHGGRFWTGTVSDIQKHYNGDIVYFVDASKNGINKSFELFEDEIEGITE